jgi:hypothetical protein
MFPDLNFLGDTIRRRIGRAFDGEICSCDQIRKIVLWPSKVKKDAKTRGRGWFFPQNQGTYHFSVDAVSIFFISDFLP